MRSVLSPTDSQPCRHCSRDLLALGREALFYRLHGLVDHIGRTRWEGAEQRDEPAASLAAAASRAQPGACLGVSACTPGFGARTSPAPKNMCMQNENSHAGRTECQHTAHTQNTPALSIMPQPGTRSYYDSIYMESGGACLFVNCQHFVWGGTESRLCLFGNLNLSATMHK